MVGGSWCGGTWTLMEEQMVAGRTAWRENFLKLDKNETLLIFRKGFKRKSWANFNFPPFSALVCHVLHHQTKRRKSRKMVLVICVTNDWSGLPRMQGPGFLAADLNYPLMRHDKVPTFVRVTSPALPSNHTSAVQNSDKGSSEFLLAYRHNLCVTVRRWYIHPSNKPPLAFLAGILKE